MKYQKILTLFALIGFFSQVAAKSINVYDISICPGETRDFFIYMNTTRTNLVSFQIDLKLPKGLKVNVDSCKLPSRILDNEQKLFVGCMDETNNVFRLVSTSYNLIPFTTADAPLVQVSITASEDFTGGSISLQDMFTVNTNADDVLWISGELYVTSVPYVKYDVDRDGSIAVNDCLSIVNYLLDIDQIYSSNFDVNRDGNVNVADVQLTANEIVNGQAEQ